MGAFNDVFPFCCYIVIGYPIKFNNGIKFFCQNDSAGHTSESVGEAEGGLHNDDKAIAVLSKHFDVVTLPTQERGNRETLKGIQHSVAEFFLLSKSDFLIKTYWSSFSDEARIFNRIPATMITLKERGQYHQLCHEKI